jgi:hypothetical protein
MYYGELMKFFQETTPGDDYPNHTYLLSDNKEFAHGYIRVGTTDVFKFKTKYRFGTKGRKFREVANTFGFVEEPAAANVERWEVKGSKGDTYVVEREAGVVKCSCSGFKFRGACKHLAVAS